MLMIQPSEPNGALTKYLPRTNGFKLTALSLINRMSPPAEDHVSYKPPRYKAFTNKKADPIAKAPR